MATRHDQIILVTGATGHLGGAVARHLLAGGWNVRALTRDAASARAQALGSLGAQVVQGDMGDIASLRPIVDGVDGVFSVQNPMISGKEAEIRQGITVADAAREAGVRQIVYGSAGIGKPGTGIDSWESKLKVEAHMRSLDLPLTILRPMALMELMIDPVYYPSVSTWRLMPRLMGEDRPVGWLAAGDFGAIAALAFAEPERFVNLDLHLTSDVQSIRQCRELYRRVVGRAPGRMPMPVWMFERFVGKDLTTMWRWLRTHEIELDPGPTNSILPGATTVAGWLQEHASTPGRSGTSSGA